MTNIKHVCSIVHLSDVWMYSTMRFAFSGTFCYLNRKVDYNLEFQLQ